MVCVYTAAVVFLSPLSGLLETALRGVAYEVDRLGKVNHSLGSIHSDIKRTLTLFIAVLVKIKQRMGQRHSLEGESHPDPPLPSLTENTCVLLFFHR